MKVGIDARMYGPNVGGGGLGRYVEQLVTQLQKLDHQNRFVLFLKPENDEACRIQNDRFEKRVVDIHWYTMKEQLFLSKSIDQEELDLVHFPHWNVPMNIKTPFIVTIHDLILLEQPHSAKVTTRNPFLYHFKYMGFRKVIAHAVHDSRAIIAVSEYTRDSILKHFPSVDPEKITVVHEGVTHFQPAKNKTPESGSIPPSPYFLYVGNAYPHKNLESLLHAFSFFHRLHPDVMLVLAGRKDIFYERLEKELEEIDIPKDRVRFIMSPSDEALHDLYRNATLYLFPSRIEGFGLPPLEAMQEGVPVAAARAGSLPEVLGDAALYFHPDDIEEMVRVMEQALTNTSLRSELARKGKEQIKRYSWETMAKEILAIYKQERRH